MATANPWLSGAGFDAYRNAGWRYLGLVAVVLVLAVEIVAKAGGAGTKVAAPPNLTSYVNQAVPASLVTTLKSASEDALTFTGTGTPILADSAKLSSASGPVKGLPTIYYQGADFCPYCATNRWPILLTLLRFGSVSGLRYMLSSPTDVYANTSTFTFASLRFTSPYVAFNEAETENRFDNVKLQTPDAANEAAWNRYNTTKYMGTGAGYIPFLDVANRYGWVGAPFVPTGLGSARWATVAKSLVTAAKTGTGAATFVNILHMANVYTAAVCASDGARPAAVCTAPGVVAARGDLPK